MSQPISKGRCFLVEHVKKSADSFMPTSDIYNNYYGISFIVSGDRQIATPDKNYFVHKGYVSPMPNGVYHRTTPLSNEPYERYGIRFNQKIAHECIAHFGKNTFQNIMSHISYNISMESQKKVFGLYEEMQLEYNNNDKYSDILLYNLLEQILVIILRDGNVEEHSEIKLLSADTLIIESLKYIDFNYASNPTVDELSSRAGLSASRFMSRFHACVGSSYISYLNTYKIGIALSLLSNTSMSIQAISDSLGFCNANYFSSTFKKLTGTSPLKCRKNT